MIDEIDENVVDFDSFMVLDKLAPLNSEMELIKNYKDDIKDLDTPSRWVYEVRKIPRYKQRFRALTLKYEFLKDYDDYKTFLNKFFSSMESFQDDRRFQKFLKICLDAGNILNTGNKRRGGAYGFKVASLKSFLSCKSVV